MAEQHLCIARGPSTQLDTYRPNVDGTLLPAVMDQIFFLFTILYTPPALDAAFYFSSLHVQ